MHPFVETISIAGGIAVAIVGAVVLLTLFYRGLSWIVGGRAPEVAPPSHGDHGVAYAISVISVTRWFIPVIVIRLYEVPSRPCRPGYENG